ncbi:MAG: alanine--tRNA ligase [Francisellaceae bacterium]|nr:alanine--tRNA ligase [Francisellaceae bacterium]
MRTSDIRKLFLEYFKGHHHSVVPGSSLVPINDPTLLFINAGMVQFKDTFLGQDERPYSRATSCQPCLRAGGKHNDLENVGYTARHHTFFEMLGNFSFGDYFKEDAIKFAWEFITKTLKLPKDKLWITVYEEDSDAERIWLEDIGIDQDRLSRCGAKDNFWSMGDVGPCGPCSEIFYDHGEHIAGGPPGSPDEDGDRYVEIWNLVFMQYNRDKSGNLTPLPKPSVDTGMGLERVAAVMQGVTNNYDIDLFKELISGIAEEISVKDTTSVSLRVIADHLRSCSFLIVDGVLPSNEGRGYVLRRIIRRAIRHGNKLGVQGEFFNKLVPILVDIMGRDYPKLVECQNEIINTFVQEEKQFARTIEQGMQILNKVLEGASSEISGEIAFMLYDTYGFPVDLTADVAREHELSVNIEEFTAMMQKQKDMARSANTFSAKEQLATKTSSEFQGYKKNITETTVAEIFIAEKSCVSIHQGDKGVLILSASSFYAESGGQVGDIGTIHVGENKFTVTDTQKSRNAILHIGMVSQGEFKVGQKVSAEHNLENRDSIRRNHSATHLLHAALRKILGEHVFQKGSIVDSNRLRFDFSNPNPVSKKQLDDIQDMVNEHVLANTLINTDVMSFDDAKLSGAMALFGEKYDTDVRVLSMGKDKFSVELCGGTHAQRTGDIGFCKITSESGVASGVRRIEAITGVKAQEFVLDSINNLEYLAKLLKTKPGNARQKLEQVLEHNKVQEKTINKLQKQLLSGGASNDVESKIKQVVGVKVLVDILPVGDVKTLRETVDSYKNKFKPAVVVLALVNEDKVNIAVGVTKDLTDKLNAGKLANFVAEKIDGKGGGRDDMAMAGGNSPQKLATAMDSVYDWVSNSLS